MSDLTRQVEELVLLRCSLLPDELLEFILHSADDCEEWEKIVAAHSDGDLVPSCVPCPAQFSVKIRGAPLWFDIELPNDYPSKTTSFNVTVRGHNISRAEQQRWQDTISEQQAKTGHVDFPVYELVSLNLLPLLHAEYDSHEVSESAPLPEATPTTSEPHHALLTSHHLKSPQKRRSLQQWSSELRLHGFAKVGHPGVIYCSGSQSSVEDFVSRVKDMQWLALKVRFVEPLPAESGQPHEDNRRGSWLEVEKIGEVVEEMRKLGRQGYVLDLGIGSAGGK